MTGRSDICLVVPPFDTTRFPPLGASVLTTGLRARGLNVRVVHGSLLFASRVGNGPYRAVCESSRFQMLGERLFLPHVYPAGTELGALEPFDNRHQPLYERLSGFVGPFLETLVRQVLATRPRMVGITSSFQQNMAAFALARMIKERAPDTLLVVGGPNIAMPMAKGLMEVFPFVDHFVSGEADTVFPDFCERYFKGGERGQPKLIECTPIDDMRVVDGPDFSDYFRALRHHQKRGRLPPELPDFVTMESSRGCWWGQRHHCTFCGLNGEGMDFRQKSPERVLSEIRQLLDTWGVRYIHASDNIMPVNFLQTVLPELAQWPDKPQLFYEVKANLRDDQIEQMAAGGIRIIQPGIESLSSPVLKLMRKGVSALQNISLLRSCRSREMTVLWSILHGFPGEEVEHYEAMLALIPKIVHLHPPGGFVPIVIDRFSPYHHSHRDFGITEITPLPNYSGLYPLGAPLNDIAYHFRGRYSTPLLDDKELVGRMHAVVQGWEDRWFPAKVRPRLEARAMGGGKIVIADTRDIGPPKVFGISPAADATLRYFERPRPKDGHPPEHMAQIEELLAKDLLVAYEGALLSVVSRPQAQQQPVAHAAE